MYAQIEEIEGFLQRRYELAKKKEEEMVELEQVRDWLLRNVQALHHV